MKTRMGSQNFAICDRTLTLPDLNAVAGVECGVAMLFPPVKMLVGSLTAQESQAICVRGMSPEAEGRTGAGSAAHMTAVLGWRG
jgi:hypothetical protein